MQPKINVKQIIVRYHRHLQEQLSGDHVIRFVILL